MPSLLEKYKETINNATSEELQLLLKACEDREVELEAIELMADREVRVTKKGKNFILSYKGVSYLLTPLNRGNRYNIYEMESKLRGEGKKRGKRICTESFGGVYVHRRMIRGIVDGEIIPDEGWL